MTKRIYFLALCSLIYASAMLYVVWQGAMNPYYNWDQLGYVGSIISWTSPSPEETYERTKAIMKAETPGWVFDQTFGSRLVQDSKAFNQRLPMYQVKFFYNVATWLVHQAGVGLADATIAVSAISTALLALFLWLWTPRHMPREIWMGLILGLTFLYPWAMETLPHFSTPDALCTFLTAAMIYAWIFRRSHIGFALCAVLAILARPDSLVLCGGLTVYFALFAHYGERMHRWKAAAILCLLPACYFALTHFTYNMGLVRWFSDAFINHMTYPADEPVNVPLEMYWGILKYSTVLMVQNPRTLTMLCLSALALLAFCFRRTQAGRENILLMLATWGLLVIRFMMFPSWGDDRYYFVYFIIILFTCGEIIIPALQALLRKTPPPQDVEQR